ncbi:hypothetical protein CBS101457_004269 [Exobasidium rhododendri]|nr:hypothetical protein CBS101457_004269 [Exobasidium rhododendri]
MTRRRVQKRSSGLQRRDPVANGTQIQLTRTFDEGQLVYTAPISIEGQALNVQVDTGSSDLWVASDRCNSAACQQKGGYAVKLFSDNNGVETGENFEIDYLVGSASGPIIVSNVSFANSLIDSQAFASCNAVMNEQLSSIQASGVMGLALPANSIIQNVLSTDVNANNTETNSSMTGSLLPGIWQGVQASYRFFGLGLQRLPSDGGNGNSTLTFGDYDRNYIPSGTESAVKYSSAIPDDDEIVRKWKLIVNDFFVTVNGTQIQIPLSSTGAAIPTAILDSGSPLNLASVNFLNAMYGAVNVGPAADGSGGYYVDCSLLLEISINVGGILIPIHPLDASLKQDNSGTGSGGSSGCIGSFQAVKGLSEDDLPAQFVLGAPFLRSVYTLYSCDSNSVNASAEGDCSAPRIGLYSLYNQTGAYQTAVNDFNKVRIQGVQLGDNSQVDGSSASSTTSKGGFGSSAKIAVGVVVGLLGIVLIMILLLLILKKRRSKLLPEEHSDLANAGIDKKDSEAIGMLGLSEKERQKAREVALLHGEFVEDQDGRASPSTGADRTLGPDAQSDWDISSKGYWEARAIKNEYQRRSRGPGQSSISQSTFKDYNDDEGQESHELVDTSAFSPR